MKNFDYIILNKFIKENEKFFTGAVIRKVMQPSRQELVIVLRNFGENRKFYININPQLFHICFMTERGEELRGIKNPKKPPMFCMLLRKYIENSRIVKINQPEGERIFEFYINSTDEVGDEIYLCLAIELMGKHSNVILYNYDTNMILGCMHNVGVEKSRERELYGGLPYIYPPKNKVKSFSGLSEELKNNEPVNEFIDSYYSEKQNEDKVRALKQSLTVKINSSLKKINNTLKKLELQKKTDKEYYKKCGDLINANLYGQKDYVDYIDVEDFEMGGIVRVNLDKTKTLVENACRYYKLYNKAKVSMQKQMELSKGLGEEKQYLEDMMFFVESASEVKDLEEILSEIGVEEEKEKVSKLNIDERMIGEYRVFVGKNNRQNDYIVSKIGRKNDYWFHAKNMSGGHVLLRLESGQMINDKIVYECAKLAKMNSAGKISSKVGVIYTKFKNIKKPPKANLGYVIYKGEEEIIID